MAGGTNSTRSPDAPAPAARFYKIASIGQIADGAASVLLDGRPVRTPARAPLVAPVVIAEAIAAEWDAQQTHILPQTMPLTRLANTAIDGVVNAIDAVQDEIVAIAGTDLVSYRADGPEGLVERQKAAWDPVVAQSQQRLGTPIAVTDGIMPVSQDPLLADAVRALVPREPLPLAAMHQLATLTGSTLIALAYAGGSLSFEAAWAAAHVDEVWNIAEWGEDEQAAERRALRRRDAQAAAFVLANH